MTTHTPKKLKTDARVTKTMDVPSPDLASRIRLTKTLVSRFPPHLVYVSPFQGLATELATKAPCRREIIHDGNHNVYSVFAVLRDERLANDLIERLATAEHSQQHYEGCLEMLGQKGISILERAYSYLICCNLGARHSTTANVNANGGWPTTTDEWKSAIYNWRNRMRLVICETRDAFTLIDKYDSPRTFFYLNPPTHFTERSRLNERLRHLQGMAMLVASGNQFYSSGWQPVQIKRPIATGHKTIWTNYDADNRKSSEEGR
ncbi:MAG: hypothetical protein ABSG53_15610 [Thermoguttaceae bacterium]|jgi:DNA adenine methylase